ncbi:MAG: hypothetical protein HYR56_05095 [Acidobacteria bacterium]|nr:hypothetical protein [Acidobacteriota bacterium]MBI3427667.1 hypothetical protein [Acidobacteriota bacterium]
MTPKPQFIITVILAAHLIAYSISGAIGITYLTAFLVCMSVLGFLGRLLWLRSSHWQTTPTAKGVVQATVSINNLSLVEARENAYNLLGDTTKFKCIRATTSFQMEYHLPASLQEFFSIYETVEAVAGDAQLSRGHIGPSAYLAGFLRIGIDIESTEIAILLGEDCVYQIDGSEVSDEDIKASQLPSIYHWVLDTAEVLYGGDNADAV